MWQLLSAVNYLHELKIIHGNVKPENILLVNENAWDIKVTDFGLLHALQLDQQPEVSACNVSSFLAPEILSNRKIDECGFEVDYWSMGVTMYYLLTGHSPYDTKEGHLLDLIKLGRFSFPLQTWQFVSISAKDLVEHLMKLNTQERFGWKETHSHPWMQAISAYLPPFPSLEQKKVDLTPLEPPQELPEVEEVIQFKQDSVDIDTQEKESVKEKDANIDFVVTAADIQPVEHNALPLQNEVLEDEPEEQNKENSSGVVNISSQPIETGVVNVTSIELKYEGLTRKRVWNQSNDIEIFDCGNMEDNAIGSPKSKKSRLSNSITVEEPQKSLWITPWKSIEGHSDMQLALLPNAKEDNVQTELDKEEVVPNITLNTNEEEISLNFNEEAVPLKFNEEAVPLKFTEEELPLKFSGEEVPFKFSGEEAPFKFGEEDEGLKVIGEDTSFKKSANSMKWKDIVLDIKKVKAFVKRVIGKSQFVLFQIHFLTCKVVGIFCWFFFVCFIIFVQDKTQILSKRGFKFFKQLRKMKQKTKTTYLFVNIIILNI
ncbi:hypothetical protein RFI_21519 [Reticulomyxa filosa]|uniref:Protein kinase domain-containing protein n=1 Tax=Reticulomyxa filosa TaxID=46433 RepID=X6MQC8_RETFI|nr:hypothetical protein RFI_21519 [Reticulomyxa filosa]|eukprot:ETO15846.1 hypothetical protein RFI_21519 [Reticulomyxa filosa]